MTTYPLTRAHQYPPNPRFDVAPSKAQYGGCFTPEAETALYKDAPTDGKVDFLYLLITAVIEKAHDIFHNTPFNSATPRCSLNQLHALLTDYQPYLKDCKKWRIDIAIDAIKGACATQGTDSNEVCRLINRLIELVDREVLPSQYAGKRCQVNERGNLEFQVQIPYYENFNPENCSEFIQQRDAVKADLECLGRVSPDPSIQFILLVSDVIEIARICINTVEMDSLTLLHQALDRRQGLRFKCEKLYADLAIDAIYGISQRQLSVVPARDWCILINRWLSIVNFYSLPSKYDGKRCYVKEDGSLEIGWTLA